MLEHFLDNRKLFFGALLVTAIIDIADTLIKSQLGLPAPPVLTYSAFMTLWIVISGIAFFVRSRAYHAVCAPIFLVLLVIWISVMFPGILDVTATA